MSGCDIHFFFLSGYTHTHTQHLSFLFPAGHVDVLQLLEVSEKMEGVSLGTGLCTSRTGTEGKDLAYKIDKKVQLSVPTKQLFPGNTTTVVICACIKLHSKKEFCSTCPCSISCEC